MSQGGRVANDRLEHPARSERAPRAGGTRGRVACVGVCRARPPQRRRSCVRIRADRQFRLGPDAPGPGTRIGRVPGLRAVRPDDPARGDPGRRRLARRPQAVGCEGHAGRDVRRSLRARRLERRCAHGVQCAGPGSGRADRHPDLGAGPQPVRDRGRDGARAGVARPYPREQRAGADAERGGRVGRVRQQGERDDQPRAATRDHPQEHGGSGAAGSSRSRGSSRSCRRAWPRGSRGAARSGRTTRSRGRARSGWPARTTRSPGSSRVRWARGSDRPCRAPGTSGSGGTRGRARCSRRSGSVGAGGISVQSDGGGRRTHAPEWGGRRPARVSDVRDMDGTAGRDARLGGGVGCRRCRRLGIGGEPRRRGGWRRGGGVPACRAVGCARHDVRSRRGRRG